MALVILLTGATGVVGGELLPALLDEGHKVRVLVRDPRKLGEHRVDVQITLGDLRDPLSIRHAMRGVDTVIHLAATIRDQPGGTIEELNGLATLRLLRLAERAGTSRFVFFSAMGATGFQRTRFFRSKALAEHAVRESPLRTTVFAPSIVYRPGDPWITLLKRLSLLPAVPGLPPQRQALECGVRIAGATVHFVDEGVDTGPIVLQAAVSVHQDDTEERLSARILAEEHRIYPEAIRLYAEGRLSLSGRRVSIREAA